MGFKIVLNLILNLNLNFFYLNIEHLKFNTIVFFLRQSFIGMHFQTTSVLL